MATRIRLRRGTAAEWAAANPVLAAGEVGVDLTSGELRVGDGITAWASLTPIGGVSPEAIEAAVAAHAEAADPHPTYTTSAEAAAAAPVQSVAGRTGAVVLAVADVSGAVASTDPRLSDPRTPDAHKATHATGGTDALTPADIGAQPAGSYAPALGADDNYVTDAEKAALHAHSNKVALDAVSGTNTGDQDLSGYVPTTRTVAGKALTGNITLAAADLTDFAEASQDVVGAMVTGAGGTYDDAAGTITLPTGGGGGSSAQVDIYYAVGAPGSQSSYTWTKPAGAKTVHVRMIQGGSGGGSGRRGAAGTVRCGGGGGGAGMIGTGAFPASDFGATETVNVGKGGAGGAAVTTDDTNGNTGGAGGVSAFGKLTSWAGVGGGGGTASAGSAGRSSNVVWMSNYVSAGGGSVGPIAGAASGSGGDGDDGGAYNQGHVPTAGGSGGGITSADAASAGGRGGYHNWHATLAAGGTSGGGAGSPGLAVHGLGAGGGGGGSSITGAAGNGGAGGLYGGGGGGGGASLNGYASGAGGNGGDGIVIITTYL